jgi:hydrogenase/urease accessory protein HupE
MKLASRAAAMVAIAAAATARLLAHDPGLSSLDVRIEPHEMVAVLALAASDARIVGSKEAVSTVARDSIELVLDGRRLRASETSAWSDENGGVHVRINYDRTYGRQLVVRSAIASRLARGHRELLSVRTEDGTVLSECMLDGELSETSTNISAISWEPRSSFARFFLLGVEHILTGYDHLLFLAGVLVVLRRWRDVIETVTAFTLAHSTTLALATTGLLLIPGRVVEPLIAASIVYVGIENLIRQVPASRWKPTFGFGLLHGLGFATVLRDLGVGAGGRGAIALPLASFNAGVEAGQLAVAALLVPLFWWLSARSTFRIRFATAWSVLVIVTGSYWLVERIG